MNILVVNYLSQMTDGDGWDHWITVEPVSYHQTKLGAEQFIKEQLEFKANELLGYTEHNTHLPDDYFVKQSNEMLNNLQYLSEGAGINCNTEEYPVYRIDEIEVKP